jgi:phosphatidate cytidylyltransferase
MRHARQRPAGQVGDRPPYLQQFIREIEQRHIATIPRDKTLLAIDHTDTLILVAIGVVANDVGAYFVGSAFGRTPLREWISPNKSIEGFLGGTICTLVVMLIIGMQDLSDTWSSTTHLLLLAIVISIMAPLGDLTESMFKRNLDIKDFGTVVRGHGGVLDRFDGFLFTLPAVYYLLQVLQPWVTK